MGRYLLLLVSKGRNRGNHNLVPGQLLPGRQLVLFTSISNVEVTRRLFTFFLHRGFTVFLPT